MPASAKEIGNFATTNRSKTIFSVVVLLRHLESERPSPLTLSDHLFDRTRPTGPPLAIYGES